MAARWTRTARTATTRIVDRPPSVVPVGRRVWSVRRVTRPVFALAVADIVGLLVVACLVGLIPTSLGLVAVGIGLVVGWIAALLLSRFMTSVVFGVGATDPVTFSAIGVLLSAAAATGRVFCLSDAPSKEAALAVHRDSHGQMPDDIFEVEEFE